MGEEERGGRGGEAMSTRLGKKFAFVSHDFLKQVEQILFKNT